ncbi:MAG: hypothetical protein HQK50_18685 [Oligoflexia bacterium]|nr:hypothetical protein [Oligoflexia bacterium]
MMGKKKLAILISTLERQRGNKYFFHFNGAFCGQKASSITLSNASLKSSDLLRPYCNYILLIRIHLESPIPSLATPLAEITLEGEIVDFEEIE